MGVLVTPEGSLGASASADAPALPSPKPRTPSRKLSVADRTYGSALGRAIMRGTRRRGIRAAIVLVPPVFWMVLFLLVPMILVGLYGFAWVNNETYALSFSPPTLDNYRRALDPGWVVLPLLFKTFGIAGLATIASLLFGYAIAYYVARIAKESRRGILMSLIIIPFWVSFVVRIFGLFAFSTPGGFIAVWLRSNGLGFLADFMTESLKVPSLQMLIFTLMYTWIPFTILPLFTSLSKIDPLVLEAASDLGASRVRTFLHVTLPLSFPGIVTGSILTFITAVGAFVEPDMVAGADWKLIGNYVYMYFSSPAGLPQGAAASVLIMVSTLLFIVVYTRYAEAEDTGVVKESKFWGRILAFFRRRRAEPSKPGAPGKLPTPKAPPSPADSRGAADGGVAILEERVGGVPRGRMERGWDVLVEKCGKYVLGIVTYGVILILFVPLILVTIFSFNSAQDSFGTWSGLSLKWYTGEAVGTPQEVLGLFSDPQIMSALTNSVIVGVLSSVFALIFGMAAAYAIERFVFRGKDSLKSVMYLGLVIPSIVLGVSIAILIRFLNDFALDPLGNTFGGNLHWNMGLASIIVGHTTFNIPLATLVLLISFREFDRSLEEAAMNLGADELTTFFKVTIPNIMPGIVSALLLCFTFSFDELPVTTFLKGQGIETLPVVIYSLIMKKWLTPEINAASTLILILSVVFVIAANKFQKGGTLFRI